jgi:hypothetical protein
VLAAVPPVGGRPVARGARPASGGRGGVRLRPAAAASSGGSDAPPPTSIAARACVCLRCGDAIAAGDDVVEVEVVAARLAGPGGAPAPRGAPDAPADDEDDGAVLAPARPVSQARAASRAGDRVHDSGDSGGYLSDDADEAPR